MASSKEQGRQRWRCSQCKTRTTEGVKPVGAPPKGDRAMTDAERSAKYYARRHPEAKGGTWYVVCTDLTRDGAIALVKGTRKRVKAAHPDRHVALLSGYPAKTRRAIWAKFGEPAE